MTPVQVVHTPGKIVLETVAMLSHTKCVSFLQASTSNITRSFAAAFRCYYTKAKLQKKARRCDLLETHGMILVSKLLCTLKISTTSIPSRFTL